MEAIRRLFKTNGPLLNLPPRYNIAPTQDISIVRAVGEGRELAQVRWGLLPFWLKEKPKAPPVTNAKAEGIDGKPMFRSAVKTRRCLIPADGFYEWQGDPGNKQPWLFRMSNENTFAFAGVWETWNSPTSEKIDSATIITTEPNALMQPVHNRMPVILPAEQYGTWLDAKTTISDAIDMLKPYPADAMKAYRVGKAVGNVKADGSELIQPLQG